MKNINLITAKVINEVKEQLLLEMATFGNIKANNNSYRIAIHGPATKDRPMPHIHIYLVQDKSPYISFNFEISLVDLVCNDQIVLFHRIKFFFFLLIQEL